MFPVGSYPAAKSALPPGLSFVLTYDTKSIDQDSFYLKHFVIPENKQNCLIYAFLNLDSTLNVNNMSLTSDCLFMTLGNLQFTAGFRHTVLLPGIYKSNVMKSSVSFLLHSTLVSSSYSQIAKYYKMQRSEENECFIEVSFFSNSNAVSGIVSTMQIALFDTYLTTDANIENDTIHFKGTITIFDTYDVSIVGSSSLNGSYDKLYINSKFHSGSGSFWSSISAYLGEHLSSEIDDILMKQKNVERSINNSLNWRDDLYKQLEEKKKDLVEAKLSYNQSYSLYLGLQNQLQTATNVLNETLANYTKVFNSTLSLNDVCVEETCSNSVCKSGLTCSSVLENAQLDVFSSCDVMTSVNQTITHFHQKFKKNWKHVTKCKKCLEITWYMMVYLSEMSCCLSQKVPFNEYYDSPYIQTTYVNQTMKMSCVTASYETSTANMYCQENDCEYLTFDPYCILQNVDCQQQQLQWLETIDNEHSDLSQQYSTYMTLKHSLVMNNINLTKEKVQLLAIQKQHDLLSIALENAEKSYLINLLSNHSLIEETKIYHPFISVSNPPPSQLLDFIIITNVSFSVLLTNETPVAFPINIKYDVPSSEKTSEVNVTINFLQPKHYNLRLITTNILQSYIVGQTRERRKRDMTESVTSTHLFSDTCISIQNINNYIEQILESLVSSFEELNHTKEVLMNISNVDNETNLMKLYGNNFNAKSLLENLVDLSSKADTSIDHLLKLLSTFSFPIWQVNMENLHVNASQTESFGCSSFLDCLENAFKLTQYIIEDTRVDESKLILNNLLSFKESLSRVGYDKSISYNEAISTLSQFLNVILSIDSLHYWCRKPPVITDYPPLVIEVLEGARLNALHCEVESSDPVTWYWTKDGIICPNCSTNDLLYYNIQMSDAGKYQCIAVNNAGSAKSPTIIIEVLSVPKLNLSLPSVLTVYEGYINGLSMACDACGTPQPGWKWFYKQTKESNWEEIPDVNSNVYTVVKPQISNKGWYKCMAYNSVGNITSSPTYLNVLDAITVSIEYPVTVNLISANDNYSLDPSIAESLIQSLKSSGNFTLFSEPAISMLENILVMKFAIQSVIAINDSRNDVKSIVSKVNAHLHQLEDGMLSLTTFLIKGDVHIYIKDTYYNVTVVDYTIGPRTYVCPPGYGLHPSHLICGKLLRLIC